MTPQQVYDALSAIDRGGANAYRQWHGRMQQLSDGFAPAMATRGALVGHLDELLKDYGGAMQTAGYEDPDPRHLLLALLIGYGSGSSMALTDGQAKMLLHSLTENHGDGWELEPTLSEQFRLIVATAISARIPLPIPNTQEARAMTETPQAQGPVQTPAPARKPIEVNHSEAVLSATAKVSDKHGVEWLITLRDGVTGAAFAQFLNIVLGAGDVLAKHDLLATNGNGHTTASASQRRTVQHPASGPAAPPSTGGPSAPPASGGNGGNGGEVKSGTAKLNKVTVQPDGKIEFYVEGFKWPFKDARGAGVVAGLFDSELGWTEEHLGTPAMYDAASFGTLYVDWEKPSKYYDVVRVHA